MKRSVLVFQICLVIALAAGVAAVTNAQDREKFGISATAGGVNAVSGRVTVTRDGQSPQLLSNQDNLVSGDVVSSGAQSQAEILLNPGSYLRLAENSQFTLIDGSLNNLQLKISRGSAIIEATGTDYVELRIGIVIGQEQVTIVRRGIYRITAQPNSTELLVRKGQVVVGNARQVVKGGHVITFANGSFLTAKLGKSQPDQFDSWSKERGKTLARANDRISSRLLNGYLADNDLGWSMSYGRSGFWTFSPFLRCYTFLPFFDGWSSPYGSFYGSLWPRYEYGGGCCDRRLGINHNPIISGGGSIFGGSSGGSGGSGGGSGGGTGGGGGPTPMRPPASSTPSQAGPRDPDSGGRSINRIRDPK